MCMLSHVRLFATPWTVASQALLTLEFFRQEYWGGLPFLHQGIFLTLGSYCHLLHLLRQIPTEPPRKPLIYFKHIYLCVYIYMPA